MTQGKEVIEKGEKERKSMRDKVLEVEAHFFQKEEEIKTLGQKLGKYKNIDLKKYHSMEMDTKKAED